MMIGFLQGEMIGSRDRYASKIRLRPWTSERFCGARVSFCRHALYADLSAALQDCQLRSGSRSWAAYGIVRRGRDRR